MRHVAYNRLSLGRTQNFKRLNQACLKFTRTAMASCQRWTERRRRLSGSSLRGEIWLFSGSSISYHSCDSSSVLIWLIMNVQFFELFLCVLLVWCVSYKLGFISNRAYFKSLKQLRFESWMIPKYFYTY